MLRARDAHRGTLRSILPQFNGRIVGEIGDGTMTTFHSAIDAVNCARQVRVLAERDPELKLRIGIHLGDVVRDARAARPGGFTDRRESVLSVGSKP